MQHADEIKKQANEIESEEDTLLKKVQNLESVPSTSNLADKIHERLTWEYPFPNAASHRSKQSVSEIKRAREQIDDYSGTELVSRFRKSILKRPKFMQEKQLSPAERGTAMHMVMQHVDLSKEVNEKVIMDQLNWMVNQELLTAEQSEVIDVKLIAQFFSSALGQRFFKAKAVHREIPFTVSLPAREVYPDWNEAEEAIFVQGIIDCILEDEDGLVLIDFKSDGITDRYKGGFEQAKPILEDRYKLQINLYTKAIEQIWKRNVAERYLFFFDGAHILQIEK
jgi:ATP-dependent helicase/nuclease subunit A